jgi:glycosyltransferase involved in cell wall biosynthesis
VRRFPVLRDRAGYVRGYAQYMSFDIPLFFRLLLARRASVVVTEPPPTTGAVVRLACWLRRTPYVYYAADIWSDAAVATDAPAWVVSGVRMLELFSLRGAAAVLSVSEGVSARLAELGILERVTLIGNGVDTELFVLGSGRAVGESPYLVYAGTASEVHGAGVFLDAFAKVVSARPDTRLVFIGQGAEREAIEQAARALPPGVVHFEPRLSPGEVADWLGGASASLASVRPGQGYDFSFPTKMYAAVACGTPVIYAGVGPGRDFTLLGGDVGESVDYEVDAVAAAMLRALDAGPTLERRAQIREWAAANVGSAAVANRAVDAIAAAARTTP